MLTANVDASNSWKTDGLIRAGSDFMPWNTSVILSIRDTTTISTSRVEILLMASNSQKLDLDKSLRLDIFTQPLPKEAPIESVEFHMSLPLMQQSQVTAENSDEQE